MKKNNMNKKRIIVVSSILLVVCMVTATISIYVSANKVDKGKAGDSEVEINYDDEEYCGGTVINVENPVVQDIYNTYENKQLNLTVGEDKKISYTVDKATKDKIDGMCSALCMEAEKQSESDEASVLYLGEKVDCAYDKASGEAKSEFDVKWLLVNGKVPVAMYNETKTDIGKSYCTPAFINDSEKAQNILVSIKNSNEVEILGYLDKEGKTCDLESNSKICPAYANYAYSIASISSDTLEATEVYNEQVYTYGEDFKLTYDTLPNGSYFYSMKTKYTDNNETDEDESSYGYFTTLKELNVENSNVVSIKDKEVVETKGLEGYNYMKCSKFLKEVWKHVKCNTKEEFHLTYEHKIDGVQKGYISTWNSLGINKALRTDNFASLDEEDKKTVETLQKMCQKQQSDSNCLMLRKVSADYLTSVFGLKDADGNTLSDAAIKSYTDEQKLELEDRMQSLVGRKMVEKGFMSASILPYVNIIFGRTVYILIKVPTGSNYYISHNVVESEAIFPTNTCLTVESIQYDKSKGKYIMITKLSQDK